MHSHSMDAQDTFNQQEHERKLAEMQQRFAQRQTELQKPKE